MRITVSNSSRAERAGIAKLARGLAMSVALSACLPLAVSAQTAGTSAQNDLSDSLVTYVLSGNQGQALINQYLTSGNISPSELARRATSLIDALGRRRADFDPQQLLTAVDRVSHLAARALSSAKITRLGVSDDYRPTRAVAALDFGPADGAVMDGFERVTPNDPRVSGDDLQGLRRPETNSLLSDGLGGVEIISLDVPNGEYRIVLMTQNLGDARYSTTPFGREIKVNGVPVLIEGNDPSRWTPGSTLSSGNVIQTSSGASQSEGYRSGVLSSDSDALIARQEGGAIIIEGRALAGKLNIQIQGYSNTKSYLTGLVVEPLNELSDITLSNEARQAIVPVAARVALETQILAKAAEVTEGIPRPDLPEPSFESNEVATAN